MTSKLTRQLIFFLTLFFPSLLYGEVELNTDTINIQSFEGWSVYVTKIRYESPDSAIQLYQFSYEYFLAQKDTLSAVNSLVHKSIVYGHKADYQSAYDNLWKALLLADEASDKRAKVWVYVQLGRYFSFYKRKEKALEYFQTALSLNKELLNQGLANRSTLVNCYYALCSTYRELENPAKAKMYLDSCLIYNNGQMTTYLSFEESYIQMAMGQ
ncbi:MAG: tetratricopeptide repeat protein, partial [Bacteroidota bacterium]